MSLNIPQEDINIILGLLIVLSFLYNLMRILDLKDHNERYASHIMRLTREHSSWGAWSNDVNQQRASMELELKESKRRHHNLRQKVATIKHDLMVTGVLTPIQRYNKQKQRKL